MGLGTIVFMDQKMGHFYEIMWKNVAIKVAKWWFSAIDIIRAINEDPPSTLRYLYNRNQFPTKSSKSGSTIHDLH